MIASYHSIENFMTCYTVFTGVRIYSQFFNHVLVSYIYIYIYMKTCNAKISKTKPRHISAMDWNLSIYFIVLYRC